MGRRFNSSAPRTGVPISAASCRSRDQDEETCVAGARGARASGSGHQPPRRGVVERIEDEARLLLETLAGHCLNRGDSDGILLHCAYRPVRAHGLDCATVWGDFFLLDALLRLDEPDRRLDPLS